MDYYVRAFPIFDVVKHAFFACRDILTFALVYIVHLEALKAGMSGLGTPLYAQAD